MASKSTPFPLGVDAGGPNGSDPAAMAAFEAQFKSFTDLMGAAPTFMNAFVDPFKAIADWPSNAGWTAWSWEQSSLASKTTPVIGLPMCTDGDRSNPDPVYKAFAAGKYDDVLRGIVDQWSQHGFKDLYIRPGYEMNGSFMAWYAGADAQTRSDWVAAFRHIADVLHAAPGANVKVIWNPCVTNWNGDLDVKTLYPGDKYVDVVGADLYSPMYPYDFYNWQKNDGSYDSSFEQWAANPVNRMHYWDYPDANKWYPTGTGQGNSLSLQNLIDFAKAHGKPLAMAETGAGGDGGHGLVDDPAFPTWLAGKLAASGVDVAMVNIWDLQAHDSDWTFTGAGANRPLEAAAWAKAFGAQATTLPATVPTTAAPGERAPDTITLSVSEDAWQGDAQFTVRVDGKQVGGTMTATASHALGQTQAISLSGNFGAGAHDVAVTFLNDAYGGSASTDRNLYVDKLVYNGVSTPGGKLLAAGTQTYKVGAAAAPVSLGSGPDTIVVNVSEDAWQGDAQFTISIDGKQIGGTQTASVSHAAGKSQAFNLAGSFGAGAHTVAVNFLNDAYGGSASTDRNLYVDSIAHNGVTVPGAAMLSGGARQFAVPASGLVVGAGPDTIKLAVTEDAWNGDAQFSVAVDGKQIGGVLTATAIAGSGKQQTVNLAGSFGTGAHKVTVNFLNDAYGGSAATDRNLHVESIQYNGATVKGAVLYGGGPRDFAIPASNAIVLASAQTIGSTSSMAFAPASPQTDTQAPAPAQPILAAAAEPATVLDAFTPAVAGGAAASLDTLSTGAGYASIATVQTDSITILPAIA